MRELLVTGATGCIGRALVFAALREGWSVRGLARSEAPAWWPSSATFLRGSVADATGLMRGIAGTQAVVHLAAPAHDTDMRQAMVQARHRLTVDGTANVARAARAAGAQVLLVSSIAVYGTPPPRHSDDRTSPDPTTPYGLAKLEAEERTRAEAPDAMILRCSVVYGPGDRGNVRRLIGAIDHGRALVVGVGSNRKSLLFSENLAARIMACLERPVAGTWCVADAPAPSQRELADEIARALNRPMPRSVPLPAALAGARALDAVALLRGRPAKWSSTIATLASWTEVDGSALDARLGYRDAVPLRTGIERTVAWVRAGSEVPPGA